MSKGFFQKFVLEIVAIDLKTLVLRRFVCRIEAKDAYSPGVQHDKRDAPKGGNGRDDDFNY
ncbi:hypothetical protein GCM10007362_08980 [Saccharibacillus endophyticus]|uniref:Uncharacterized protein n=1 Tax=Saccharibacillus endophyticus TaxID=2060666 RepID=A0ABQ1ZR24_9BACL|nr:hypothetical protein GCM10007362_08980 [Saccharibacillus endophyticus]